MVLPWGRWPRSSKSPSTPPTPARSAGRTPLSARLWASGPAAAAGRPSLEVPGSSGPYPLHHCLHLSTLSKSIFLLISETLGSCLAIYSLPLAPPPPSQSAATSVVCVSFRRAKCWTVLCVWEKYPDSPNSGFLCLLAAGKQSQQGFPETTETTWNRAIALSRFVSILKQNKQQVLSPLSTQRWGCTLPEWALWLGSLLSLLLLRLLRLASGGDLFLFFTFTDCFTPFFSLLMWSKERGNVPEK